MPAMETKEGLTKYLLPSEIPSTDFQFGLSLSNNIDRDDN